MGRCRFARSQSLQAHNCCASFRTSHPWAGGLRGVGWKKGWMEADAARWERLDDLRGRRLRCHCASGTPCHADSLVALFCTKTVEVVKAAGQSPSGVDNSIVGPSVSSGNLPRTAAASRAFPPTCCPSPSLSGRRESAAAPGNLPGQAISARAYPAVTLSPRGRGDSTACTSGDLPGQHLSARALPAASSGDRGLGDSKAGTPGNLPGQLPPARAFPAGGGGRPSTKTSLVDNSWDLQVSNTPEESAPRCPVVPLEIVDELRAPGAGSLAAGPAGVPRSKTVEAGGRRPAREVS